MLHAFYDVCEAEKIKIIIIKIITTIITTIIISLLTTPRTQPKSVLANAFESAGPEGFDIACDDAKGRSLIASHSQQSVDEKRMLHKWLTEELHICNVMLLLFIKDNKDLLLIINVIIIY